MGKEFPALQTALGRIDDEALWSSRGGETPQNVDRLFTEVRFAKSENIEESSPIFLFHYASKPAVARAVIRCEVPAIGRTLRVRIEAAAQVP
jgi:hypothetical protein